ncbi:MAG TPA: DUF2635 domain-containing protein [Aliidongia sp.]|uniref:DUF2635 domain-containing protein n=1 Tax=Aliidongia sp. TaxID=1914230 RepID=UPI002DDCC42D|nr:DUF2635 domain-containing protein [Aliidongia sp.]HEV2675275.1 DUF2635 domain-containing protein [Aliidongia sp.]
MADLRYVQAAPGRRVLDPNTMKPIPAAGNDQKATIQIDAELPFWFRRLRDDDVIEVDEAGNPIETAEPEPANPPAPVKPSKGAAPADAGAPVSDPSVKE